MDKKVQKLEKLLQKMCDAMDTFYDEWTEYLRSLGEKEK